MNQHSACTACDAGIAVDSSSAPHWAMWCDAIGCAMRSVCNVDLQMVVAAVDG